MAHTGLAWPASLVCQRRGQRCTASLGHTPGGLGHLPGSHHQGQGTGILEEGNGCLPICNHPGQGDSSARLSGHS
eukprot:8388164-Lingulodinium_polyedra.AAC.1